MQNPPNEQMERRFRTVKVYALTLKIYDFHAESL